MVYKEGYPVVNNYLFTEETDVYECMFFLLSKIYKTVPGKNDGETSEITARNCEFLNTNGTINFLFENNMLKKLIFIPDESDEPDLFTRYSCGLRKLYGFPNYSGLSAPFEDYIFKHCILTLAIENEKPIIKIEYNN